MWGGASKPAGDGPAAVSSGCHLQNSQCCRFDIKSEISSFPPCRSSECSAGSWVNICHADISARWEMPCIILEDNSELIAKCRHLKQQLPGDGRDKYHHALSSERRIYPNILMGMSLASCPCCGENKPNGCSTPWWYLGEVSSWSRYQWGATCLSSLHLPALSCPLKVLWSFKWIRK